MVDATIRRRPLVGVGAVCLASVGWGLGTVASSGVLSAGVTPEAFTVIELFASVVTLACVTTATRTTVPRRSMLRVGPLLGLIEPGLTYVLLNLGLSLTSAGHAALIGAAEPAFAAALAWIVFRDRLGRSVIAFMMLALVGVGLVVSASASAVDPSGGGDASVAGDLLVVVGIACAAIYVVGSSRVIDSMSPLALVSLQQRWALCLAGGVLGGRALLGGQIQWPATLGTWLSGAAIGVGASALPFWAYLTSLRHLRPAIASQFLALVPIVGFVGAIIFRDEAVTLASMSGAVVVVIALLGIAVSESFDDRREIVE